MKFDGGELGSLVAAAEQAGLGTKVTRKLLRLHRKNIVLLDDEMALAHWQAMDGALRIARERGMERWRAMDSARLVEEQLRPVVEGGCK